MGAQLVQAAAAAGWTLTLVCAAGGCWGSVSEPGGPVPGWGLAGLVVVLVGLDQAVQDPGELADVALTPAGQHRFDQVWPAHADGIGRYFAQPLAPRDIGELARILDSLIQANQNHDQPD